MFNRAIFENSRPDGVAVLEIADDRPGLRLFVPLKRSELRGEVLGPLAALRLTHIYGYTREQCDRVLEALYRFPLPGDAAVTGVTVRFGAVEIKAELRERGQAEQEYEQAKKEGRQAALTTRESPDVFTLRLAGLQPDQEITVETTYVQLARPEGDGWSLRIPLTTSPRYVRSDEITGRHAHGQPLALLRDPGHRFSLDLTLSAATAAESATHSLAVTADGDRLRVRLQDGEVLPDRDCVLRWRPVQDATRPTFQVWTHGDAGQICFLALVTPPVSAPPRPMVGNPSAESEKAPQGLRQAAAATSQFQTGGFQTLGQLVPREVILLVDHSGSMEGAKWAAADWAVKQFLAGLTPADAFALGLFHNDTRWLAKAPTPATADAVQKAIAFLEGHRDSGGTELGVALEQALGLPSASGERARHVLIVTDAEVTDAGRLLRLADEAMRPAARRRISLLCIDAAPNAFLVHQLAERGGGVARFLTSSPEEGDITTALDEVLADWAAPVLVGLRLVVNRPGVQAAGRIVTEGAVDLGDLPAGRPIWAAGRVTGEPSGLTFRLLVGSNQQAATWQGDALSCPAIKALFGSHRILALEHLIHAAYDEPELRAELARLGYDPDRVFAGPPDGRKKLYAENARRAAEEALRGLLVAEALDFGLASSETAFVATRTEAGKPVEGTVLIANALPTGWSEEFLSRGAPVLGMAMPAAPTGGLMARSFVAAGAPPPARAVMADALDLPAFLRRSPSSAVREAKTAAPTPLFSGAPQFSNGQAVLFDSARPADAAKFPNVGVAQQIEVRFPAGAPRPESIDPGLALLIFVDDLSAPRAKVRLADIVRQGGSRPLNLRRQAGQVVRIVLADPAGAWAKAAPALAVTLIW